MPRQFGIDQVRGLVAGCPRPFDDFASNDGGIGKWSCRGDVISSHNRGLLGEAVGLAVCIYELAFNERRPLAIVDTSSDGHPNSNHALRVVDSDAGHAVVQPVVSPKMGRAEGWSPNDQAQRQRQAGVAFAYAKGMTA